MQELNHGFVNASYDSNFIYSDNTLSRKQNSVEAYNNQGINHAENEHYDLAITSLRWIP
jgi:hypothetical protein